MTTAAEPRPSQQNRTIRRIEVWPSARAGDPRADSVKKQARDLGVECASVRTARVYLIESPLDEAQLERVRTRLLTDPVLERSLFGSDGAGAGVETVEVHPLPGVMDPAAQTVEDAIEDLTGRRGARVQSGLRYDFEGITPEQADSLARRLLANAVIESVHREPYTPGAFPTLPPADQTLRHVTITTLSDEELKVLSREGHLFLSLEEMKAIRDYYKAQGREPTDVELETLAQTWSEHCVHKTLKSRVRYTPPEGDVIDWAGRPGVTVTGDGTVEIDNLLKSTVAAATHELIADGLDWTLSVFVDNAGIIRFDDEHAVCVKVETHNHPSAIEPYGGAATGVGGCIRDIMGTGLSAKPIANTDVFCVAMPDMPMEDVPEGCLHPRRILKRVVEGVRDYGNRMGIPTLNGAVHFDNRYIGNPLVFCGCVGVMPIDKTHGDAQPGDRIIALGGRTGRDGIHGATFSSAELTDEHADEFSHAVQIGNAIEEKRTLDAILRARDHESGCLFSAITDCGAGGFSSAIGEMGEQIGAEVHLDKAPLKYDGLRYDEIWISESQERMVLAVPAEKVALIQAICDEESVELADLGTFGTPDRELILNYEGEEAGRLGMEFLHDGIPMPTREACSPSTQTSGTGVPPVSPPSTPSSPPDIDVKSTLLDLLRDPNIASKRWIIRQYDHEVQGNTVIKPLVGPGGIGPGDAAVIQPVPGTKKGLAIACGMATPIGDPAKGGDPYLMALAAVDECVRNLVCVGANPDKIAILDNFCWPSCDRPENMGALVRACMGCYDAAKAYRAPFISGKDSLNNQFRTKDGSLIEIPPTLLITGVAEVEDVSKCVTMDLKGPHTDGGDLLVLIAPHLIHFGDEGARLDNGAFIRNHVDGLPPDARMKPDLDRSPRLARAVHYLINSGLVRAAHDCSEGGPLISIAEMLLASGDDVGAVIEAQYLMSPDDKRPDRGGAYHVWSGFVEQPGSYLLQIEGDPISRERWRRAERSLFSDDIDLLWSGEMIEIGSVSTGDGLRIVNDTQSGIASIPISDLSAAFHSTLDW